MKEFELNNQNIFTKKTLGPAHFNAKFYETSKKWITLIFKQNHF